MLGGLDPTIFTAYKEERQCNMEKFDQNQLVEDIFALFRVAGIQFYFNKPAEQLEGEEVDIPEQKDRPSGYDNTQPPPNDWPIGVSYTLI